VKLPVLIVAVALILAGGAGFLTARALSQGGPVKTVTIDVGKGEKGDPGPAGPAGPKGEAGPKGDPGEFTCPAGYTLIDLRINHPSGQTTILTCEKD
jgi:hypothetical protein